ncbi:hypothetical protein Salat_0524100 [Sesamum alatum]|uniref:Uncharacterized protein n=1 Tax=Sesamum alatum TaxID=300844 RepID=A0AAE1YP39_9LAMI|nr:hypothetical protein Salat_0524100 [Sesamum alatum]
MLSFTSWSKRAESLDHIDLNCLYDAGNDFIQPSLPSESENPSLVDLSLRINTSLGATSNRTKWPIIRERERERNNRFTSDAYLADFTIQKVPSDSHIQKTSSGYAKCTIPANGTDAES